MSDEALIDEIRSAMHAEVDELRVPPELLARALASPPRRRLPVGWLIPALAVGVAALVAVVAVTSLGHQAPAPRGAASSVPPAARRLVSHLAVLRRGQSRADVLPHWAVRETESLTDHARLVAGLSRRVGSVNLGQDGRARVYVIVQRVRHRGDVASIAFVGPFRQGAAINGPAVAAGGDQVAATARGLTADPGQVSDLWGAVASIVPDGVTRVKWVFTREGTSSGLPAITVWPTLRDNVAIGQLPPTQQAYLSSAVWYGAGGQVLQSFGAATSVPAGEQTFRQALQASVHEPVAQVLVRHFGVLRTPSAGLHAPGLDHAAIASLIEPNIVDLNVAQTRSVAYGATSAKLLVVPGSQGMALRSVSPIVNQASGGTPAALSGQLVTESRRFRGHRMVVGLAPDGNRTVTVLLPGGGVRTARVVDNVYSVIVPAGARTVVLLVRNSAGRRVRLRL